MCSRIFSQQSGYCLYIRLHIPCRVAKLFSATCLFCPSCLKLGKEVDVKKAQNDAEAAFKVAGLSMKTAGKMLEALEELEDMNGDIW